MASTPIIRKIVKSLKYGMRAITTVFIPIITIPILGGFGFGMTFQCGFLYTAPLILVWIQTIFAWIDDFFLK